MASTVCFAAPRLRGDERDSFGARVRSPKPPARRIWEALDVLMEAIEKSGHAAKAEHWRKRNGEHRGFQGALGIIEGSLYGWMMMDLLLLFSRLSTLWGVTS